MTVFTILIVKDIIKLTGQSKTSRNRPTLTMCHIWRIIPYSEINTNSSSADKREGTDLQTPSDFAKKIKYGKYGNVEKKENGRQIKRRGGS